MRPFALLAAVLLLAAASFGVAGCGSLVPSTDLLGSTPAAAAPQQEQQPEGALTVSATLALGNILGAPKPVTDRMVRMLDAASRRANLALLNYAGAQGDYRLQGDLRADLQGNKIRVSFRWQVLDKAGALQGSIAGALMVSGIAADPWGEVSDATLQTIAERGIAMVSRQMKMLPGVPAPLPPAPGGLAGAGENAPVALNQGPPAGPANQEMPIDTSEALQLVNDYRRSNGLKPLTLDNHLGMAALALAADMAKHNRLSHTGPNGAGLAKRLKTAGYNFGLAAENIGAGQNTLGELIESWRNDPAQSRNMLLPDATQMGIASKYRPDTNYKTFWTLVVAAP